MTRDSQEAARAAQDADELVVRFLERIDAGDESPSAVLGRLCAEHPELAEDLRASVHQLGRMGLVAPAETDDVARIGPYRLGRRLGSGGMGVVHLAWRNDDEEHPVALKVLRSDQIGEPGLRERFAREVQAASRLDHPNIVRVVDRRVATDGESAALPYVALEYHRGGTLDAVIRRGAELSPAPFDGASALEALGFDADPLALPSPLRGEWWRIAVRIVREVARALAHAHARQVLHRDVKPSNVLLTPEGRVLLFDFGLATFRTAGRLTATGVQLGSLPYMPPEALSRSGDQDERSDVYSLGVTAYELLTFHLPFDDGDRDRLGLEIERGGAPPPSRWLAHLPREVTEPLDVVIQRAMEVDPRARYASADALAADLTQLLRGEPIEARAPSQLTRTARWMRRRPFVAATAVLSALLVLGAPTGYGLVARQHASAMERSLEAAADQLGGLATAVEGVLGSLPEGALDGSNVQALARLDSVDMSLDAIRLASENVELLDELERTSAAEVTQRIEECHRKLLLAKSNALQVLRRNDELQEVLTKLVERCERGIRARPDDLHALYHLGRAHTLLSGLALDSGDSEAALEHAREALTLMDEAVSQGFREPGTASERAAAHIVLGRAASRLEDHESERAACLAAIEILEARDMGEHDRFDLRRLGNAHLRLGVLDRDEGDRSAVFSSFVRAREYLEAAVEVRPADPVARGLLSRLESEESVEALRAADFERARACAAAARRHLDVMVELRADEAETGQLALELAALQTYLDAAAGSSSEALVALRTSLDDAHEQWAADPGDLERVGRYFDVLVNSANALITNEQLPKSRHEEALGFLDRASRLLEESGEVLEAGMKDTGRIFVHYNRTVAEARLGRVAAARAAAHEMAELAGSGTPFELRFLADAIAELVDALRRDGRPTVEEERWLADVVVAAVEAGYEDEAELRGHPLLAPVIDDPRVVAALESL